MSLVSNSDTGDMWIRGVSYEISTEYWQLVHDKKLVYEIFQEGFDRKIMKYCTYKLIKKILKKLNVIIVFWG